MAEETVAKAPREEEVGVGIQTVVLRNDFYRDSYRKIMSALLLALRNRFQPVNLQRMKFLHSQG